MPSISSYSLKPFNNNFTEEHLLHLLRRTLFGVNPKDRSHFASKNLQECIDTLLKPSATPQPPLEEYFPGGNDMFVTIGETWVNKPFAGEASNSSRNTLLRMWWTGQILNRDYSITEKMTLFWHNHFVTEIDVVRDCRYSYQYAAMLRKYALGNFKQLIKEGTVCPAMLVYLGGNTNFKSAPNENFARELMELFTLGKGYGVQYTEDDVKAAARVLTGWHDDKDAITGTFNPDHHNTDNKQFSAFFNHAIIKGRTGKAGAEETDELIDLIFTKKETARFICRNLYRWFLYAHVDDKIEQEIIVPLAEILYRSNFEIAPVLKTLLTSEHFFDPAFRGCIVKSPADFLIGASLQIDTNCTIEKQSYPFFAKTESWFCYHFFCEELTMRIGDPPSVAGWPAYYQTPKYYQWWVNSAVLSMRKSLLSEMSNNEGLLKNGCTLNFDFPAFVQKINDANDAEKLTKNCLHLLCAIQPDIQAIQQLVQILESDMGSSYYWGKAWQTFLESPTSTEARSVIESRLQLFFSKIFGLPEYQTM